MRTTQRTIRRVRTVPSTMSLMEKYHVRMVSDSVRSRRKKKFAPKSLSFCARRNPSPGPSSAPSDAVVERATQDVPVDNYRFRLGYFGDNMMNSYRHRFMSRCLRLSCAKCNANCIRNYVISCCFVPGICNQIEKRRK